MRAQNVDYSEAGAYFITICTQDRKELFWDMSKVNRQTIIDGFAEPAGAITGRPHHLCPISHHGEIVEKCILDIPNHYDNVIVDKYAIMADHLHMVLIILPDENGRLIIAPTVSRVVKQLKSAITKQVGFPLWQRSYFDHIIRCREDFDGVCRYIYENPIKWAYGEEEEEYKFVIE